MNNRVLIYVVGEFPSRTETFIWQEILYMSRHLELYILALKKGEVTKDHHALGEALGERVIYLPPILSASIGLSFLKDLHRGKWSRIRDVWKGRKKKGSFLRNLKISLLCRYASSLSPIRRAGHIHAHFAGFPTSLAWKLAVLLKVPFSFTAHAHDIYVEQDQLEEKIAAALFVVTCTGYNKKYLETLSFSPGKIHLIYHGVDLERWTYTPPASFRSGTLHILMIGRLVEKKGTIYLLKALEKLKGNFPFHCVIVGEGQEFPHLSAYSIANDLSDLVSFVGWQSQEEIASRLREADVFVLPSLIASDRDRDGLPNVLLEAMASGVPVVSTQVSAIPELIKQGINGLLIPAKRADKLAEALTRLYRDSLLRTNLAAKGRETVEKKFDKEECNRMFSELVDSSFRTIF